MNVEYLLRFFVGVLIAVVVFIVSILFGAWWVEKSAKKILGEKKKTNKKGRKQMHARIAE